LTPLVSEVVVVGSEVPGVAAGARLLAWADRVEGSLGHAAVDGEAVQRGRAALHSGRPAAHEVALGDGRCSLYVEPHAAPEALVIVGAGHIAQPLCSVGAMLGFRVTVLDDRPDFATLERFPEAERVLRADFSDPFRGVPLGRRSYLVLATRGHRYDFEALLRVFRAATPPAYVGMVASRRRTRATLEQLAREGLDPGRLRSLRAPVGLDLGAETPAEIAVAIAAEIVRTKRKGV
jgi:xanthine dehydrogenase accessory factor